MARAAMVSLTFDDGLNGTYDFAYPVLSKYGVPGVSGIITSRIEPDHVDFMNWEEIDKLAGAGWEIASHSVHHVRPIDVPVSYAKEPIKEWTLVSSDPPIYRGHYDYMLLTGLFDSGRPLTAVADAKELKLAPGTYFFDRIYESVLIRPFKTPEYPTQLDIRAFSYEREMEQSKKELADHGIEVKTYITPYNYWTDEAKEASKRYCQFAATGEGLANRPGNFDRYAIKRYMVHTNDTAASLIRIVKENTVDKNSWVIFCLHSIGDNTGWEPWSSENLDKLIAWLKQSGIDIVTISGGAERMAKLAPGK
ncbi:MAG: polysaccharide deacetylase family protein [Desulfovibrionaceae bacterium]|nr:polysaccharide deacetylase family protein [Desulfovibrionaceae bacterium]MBF0513224.1 polysaccharide deacetylase family protein [Desulfovibrionaceae bacterium]